MSSSKIKYVFLDSPALQNGLGVPNHIAPLGSLYSDYNTGVLYTNKDGLAYWEPFVNNPTNYIHFNTGKTTTYNGGDLFWVDSENALSYKPYTLNNDVTVNLGQESLIRVYNDSTNTILNGKAVHITGSTLSVPTITLATAAISGTTLSDKISNVSGVATHDIPTNTYGFITNFGVVRDIDTSSFNAGDEIYLSDTTDGGYTNDPSSLKNSSRTSFIGWVITSSVNGKILVVPQNEDTTQTLTTKERNILLGDVASTGLYYYTGVTVSSTTFNISPVKGWVVFNTGEYATKPEVIEIDYSGGTNIPVTNLTTANNTFLLVNSASTLVQQTSFPTPQQRRENIYLGKIIHPNRTTIQNANNLPDFTISPMSAIRDLWTPIRAINMGVLISPNGTNLSINQSSGTLWGNGFGWVTNPLKPNTITLSAQTPATFQYRSQTGATTGNLTSIIPSSYDLNGVVTPVGGGSNSSTNQRVYIFSTGVMRIQYGQQVYGSLADAVAGVQSETFVEFENNRDNGLLIGIISVNKNATDLTDTSKAIFHLVSKFGEVGSGGAGGSSTTTLQQAYDNSITPEITINSVLDGLSIKNGTGNADNVTRLLEGVNAAGDATSFIKADGSFSGLTYYGDGSNLTGIGGSSLSGLTDVTISSGVTTGSTLMYDGSVWNDVDPFDYFDAKPVMYQKHVNMPTFAAATVNNIEGVPFTVANASARNWADTNDITRSQRMGLVVSTTGNLASMRQLTTYLSINGGFNIISAFNMAENATDTAIRFFMGLSTTISFSNVEPNTLLNCAGFCRLSTSNNIHLVHNDGSGTATTVDLGSDFPANTISSDKYKVIWKVLSTGLYLRIDRVGTIFYYETTLISDIPAASTGLNFGAYIVDTTGASTATGFDWYGTYIKI